MSEKGWECYEHIGFGVVNARTCVRIPITSGWWLFVYDTDDSVWDIRRFDTEEQRNAVMMWVRSSGLDYEVFEVVEK